MAVQKKRALSQDVKDAFFGQQLPFFGDAEKSDVS
jgi:hypothetical protein